jgi:hypothetical protein
MMAMGSRPHQMRSLPIFISRTWPMVAMKGFALSIARIYVAGDSVNKREG